MNNNLKLCKHEDHVCCNLGHYYTGFAVIDEKTQDIKKIFTCSLKALKYAEKNSLWLVQEISLGQESLIQKLIDASN